MRPGTIVNYRLSSSDAISINEQRERPNGFNHPKDHPRGNPVHAGDIVPAIFRRAVRTCTRAAD